MMQNYMYTVYYRTITINKDELYAAENTFNALNKLELSFFHLV